MTDLDPPPPLLIVDDDAAIRIALRQLLAAAGLPCVLAASPGEALAALQAREHGLLLADLNFRDDTTSGQEGLALIREARALDPDLPIVALTAWGSVPLAVQALQQGASDFLEKPWDNTRLLTTLQTQLQLRQARLATRRLAGENQCLRADGSQAGRWVADSPVMQALMNQVQAVAPSQVSLLISGENGTGKTQLAEAIHRQSARADKPFIAVNMGAIPETLFESEMFGHERGAFTDARQTRIGRFELADGGTLFLDEIGNLPLAQQAKLLQALESGHFERLGSGRQRRADVRLIAATNEDLRARVEAGSFRRDLYYRLNTVCLHMPALRQRGEDVVALARLLLAAHAEREQRPVPLLSPDALEALRRHPWPGNVRELSHCMARACLLATGPLIHGADLALQGPAGAEPPAEPHGRAWNLEEAERAWIEAALRHCDGHANEAARLLGLSRSALYRRLGKHGL
ncbi:sigma-54 dependent transcriptional regulator [Pelomonas sp. APW6]|uniref:Sigma-54 dependent transcriptional regulator n=1 Tax=Roseateles subflavus TaxID=3053353 RepID=A0ABT7LJX4_9BURK|nr:sigma-54 dependent transcriptional regulator [Pelomonas sp. APW6]MDL5033170.1 sigma-54 dependent transcriptional regulator [Pelomonas sp. APW6]